MSCTRANLRRALPQLLAERAPCFEALKVVSAWAAYYDYNTFDQNAFMGRVAGHDGVLLACGHSGHGATQLHVVIVLVQDWLQWSQAQMAVKFAHFKLLFTSNRSISFCIVECDRHSASNRDRTSSLRVDAGRRIHNTQLAAVQL